ncbi:MAG: helix-turn-helix transcriptional regulator [Pseudomonadota bacterium]
MGMDQVLMDDFSEEAATFGDRLAAAREAQSLSQSQLARRMGLRLQTVQNWESDRSEPRANKLQMLAGFLNVSMVWLLTGEGEGSPTPSTALKVAAPPLAEALEELRSLRLGQAKMTERMALLEKKLRQIAAGS